MNAQWQELLEAADEYHDEATWAECPGCRLCAAIRAVTNLSDPGASAIGAFHGPNAGAPGTEMEAAIRQYPKSGTDRLRVLELLHRMGDYGCTDEEISIILHMRLYTAAPRRNELVKGQWARDSGRRRPTTTGSDAAVWILTGEGKVNLDSR